MNKNLIYLISTALILLSCQTNSDQMRIKGSTDLEDNSRIFRIVPDLNNQPKVLDTLVVQGGSFDLSVEVLVPTIHFLQVEGQQGSFPFVAESGTVDVEIYKDSLGVSKATGTVSNDDFMKYKSETKVYIVSLNGIGNDLQQATILKDSLLIEDLQEQYQEVLDQIKDYELNFVKSAPNSLISILILERFITNKSINQTEGKEIFDTFSERIKNSDLGKKVKNMLQATAQVKVGFEAPFFEGPTPQGDLFDLKDQLGKVTIIDFWASWCRPCRVENPNLVRLFKKHQNQGLRIVGVSLDKTKTQWIRAISDDGLIWDHVSNLQFWNDPIARLYKVRSIPATFILDEKGVIVARDLRGRQLDQKIAELLSSI
jgi:thiol-disulfide isomerase/thioredoxin